MIIFILIFITAGVIAGMKKATMKELEKMHKELHFLRQELTHVKYELEKERQK